MTQTSAPSIRLALYFRRNRSSPDSSRRNRRTVATSSLDKISIEQAPFTLERIVFHNDEIDDHRQAVRGKTSGVYGHSCTFQWTQAVQALALLTVKTRLLSLESLQVKSAKAESVMIEGAAGSLASSLDYALDKKPIWLMDLFGVSANGNPVAQRLILRTNAGRKLGPVVVLGFNQRLINASGLAIFVDGVESTKNTELESLLAYIRSLDSSVLPEDSIVNEPESHALEAQKIVTQSPLIFCQSQLCIRATTLVPFFLNTERSSVAGAPISILADESSENCRMLTFSDGFAVTVLNREYSCTDVADFLRQRRNYHLDLLSENSEITALLCSQQQEKGTASELLTCYPKRLCYVMSVHEIDNEKQTISALQCELMCEPSIIGITDDPSEEPPQTFDAATFYPSSRMTEQLRAGIQTVSSPHAHWYVGWANVLTEHLHASSTAHAPLLQLEITLQKLWYKLFLYTQELQKILNATQLPGSVLKEVSSLIAEYLSFIQLDPLAATHLQHLKRSLIATSHISENYRSLLGACELLGYGKKDLLTTSFIERR